MNTWDEYKREKNRKDHGIDFADLEGFFDTDLLTREDTRQAYSEKRLQRSGYRALACSMVLPCSSCGHHAARMVTQRT